MKRAAVIVLLALLALAGYLATQQPTFWCNRQWAGVALLRDGYRSWSVRFCDGEAFIDGKMRPVVLTTNAPDGFRVGHCLKFQRASISRQRTTTIRKP